MTKQVINYGTAPNDGTGDTLRAAAIKMNANFDELYTLVTTATASSTLPAITGLNVTASGSSGYLFDQYGATVNPTVYALSCTTIAFILNCSGHPFQIQSTASGGTNYNTGLTHIAADGTVSTGTSAQGKTSGTLYWKIPYGITGSYKYQCSAHAGMNGVISIRDITTITSI
jgi:plastocyanin